MNEDERAKISDLTRIKLAQHAVAGCDRCPEKSEASILLDRWEARLSFELDGDGTELHA